MRNPRAPCARRERTTSRAALLRAADTRRTALGLAAVDAVPVLAGHGPQAVALDMTRLLARACAGTRLTRVRSIAPRETLMDLHAIDQTRSREQRRVDGVGRRRPTVLGGRASRSRTASSSFCESSSELLNGSAAPAPARVVSASRGAAGRGALNMDRFLSCASKVSRAAPEARAGAQFSTQVRALGRLRRLV